jgi:hypothetical protein
MMAGDEEDLEALLYKESQLQKKEIAIVAAAAKKKNISH